MARRTQAQLAETRAAIIASGKQLFADKGFARTQVAEIAKHAGVGMSAFYGQFEDKAALFLLIINEVFNEVHSGILEVRRSVNLQNPQDAVTHIQRTYEMFFEALQKHPQITLSAFRSGFSAIPGLESWYWQLCNAVGSEMSKDLATGEATGLIQIDNHRDMADAMIGMVQHLGYRMVLEGSPTPLAAARMCTRYTLGSLLMSMPQQKMIEFLPLIAAIPHGMLP